MTEPQTTPPKSPTATKSLEDTAWEVSMKISNGENTYEMLMEFAYKILLIAGVKII